MLLGGFDLRLAILVASNAAVIELGEEQLKLFSMGGWWFLRHPFEFN